MVYIHYLQKRFPVLQAFLFSFGYVLLAYGLINTIYPLHQPIRTFSCLLITFFFFLLRLRITDEFKDKDIDRKLYPHRPLSNGDILENQLYLIFICAAIGETIPLFFLNSFSRILYFLLFLYSLLMAKEFFLKEWLTKHFTLYFVVHEMIFILYGLFFLVSFAPFVFLQKNLLIVFLTVLTLAPVMIEIVRKFHPRFDPKGKMVPDTYSVVWGRSRTIIILLIITIIMGTILFLIHHTRLVLIFTFVMSILFFSLQRLPDKYVTVIGAVTFLGFGILLLL